MRLMLVRTGVSVVAWLLVAHTAAAQPFQLTVERDRAFGSDEGVLVVDDGAIRYDAASENDSQTWSYEELKQVRLVSPTRVELVTWQTRSWIAFGGDRTYRFQTREPVSDDLVMFLLDRVPLPPVVAVVPRPDRSADVRVPVRLRHGGTQGFLEMGPGSLAYRSHDDGRASRLWRLEDLHLVFQPDRHRLTVRAYEGGGGRIGTYEFDLRELLPRGALEAIWAGMHRPSWPRLGPRE